jgi:hypothetical protein
VDGSPAGDDLGAVRETEGASRAFLASADYEEVVLEVEAGAPMESLSDVPAEEPAIAPAAEAAEIVQQSQLNAGEVDDNARWDDYFLFLRNYQGPDVIRVDVSERHQIWVTDSDGRPALGVLVEISADGREVARLRTHSDGRVYFFPHVYADSQQESQGTAYDVQVTIGSETVDLTIPAGTSQREWQVVHPAAGRDGDSTRLDVLFLIDATGSMADEIAQLKDNIPSNSRRTWMLLKRRWPKCEPAVAATILRT